MPTTIAPFWQLAWDEARPHLSSIRDALPPTIPISRILRVGQLDAELLDGELVQLLKEPLVKALELMQPSFRTRFEPELTLLIQAVLYKYSVWEQGASYGAKLQGLRYRLPRRATGGLTPAGMSRKTLIVHGALTVLIPYLHSRIRGHALSRAWPDAPSINLKRKAWEVLSFLESTHAALGLLSFVAFLWDGRYRTLADRLLNLRLVPAQRSMSRNVSYEFMNRQMVWHAFTEFLLFLLPLINTRILRRRALGALSRLRELTWQLPGVKSDVKGKGKEVERQRTGKYYSLPPGECAICTENASFKLGDMVQASAATATDPSMPSHPITTPYVASCGDVFCYFCLSERMIRAADDGEDGWECLRCGDIVRAANRLEEDNAEDGTGTSMSFDIDDLSLNSDSSFRSSSPDEV